MTGYVLGLDVGGTKIASAMVGPDGTCIEATTTATAGGGLAVVQQVAEVIASYRVRHRIERTGLVVPGAVDPATGVVRRATNLGWHDLDVARLLADRLTPPFTAHLDNDATAAAWAEHRFGGHDGHSIVLVTVGTGLGGGLVVGNTVARGHTGAGGEVGHLPLEPGGRLCECGSRGCWEQYASGRALQRAAADAGWPRASAAQAVSGPSVPDGANPAGSALSATAGPVVTAVSGPDGVGPAGPAVSAVSGPDVLAAAAQGDTLACDIVAGVARQLVRGITVLTAVLDPACVLLGGGLGTDLRFLPFVRAALAAAPPTPPRSPVDIRPAALGPLAGVIGAADLACRDGAAAGPHV